MKAPGESFSSYFLVEKMKKAEISHTFPLPPSPPPPFSPSLPVSLPPPPGYRQGEAQEKHKVENREAASTEREQQP